MTNINFASSTSSSQFLWNSECDHEDYLAIEVCGITAVAWIVYNSKA